MYRITAHIAFIKSHLLYIMLISLLICLYQFRILSNVQDDMKNIQTLLLFCFGYLDIYKLKFMVPILVWILPQLHLIFILGEFIAENMNKNAALIFTRTNNRTAWILKEIRNLAIYILGYYFLLFLFIIIQGIILGFKIHTIEEFLGVFIMYFFQFLLSLLLILFINLASMYYKQVLVYSVILTVYVFSILLAGTIAENFNAYLSLIKWLPFSNGLVGWHDLGLMLESPQSYSLFYFQHFYLHESVLYLICFITSIIYLMISKFKRMDLY